MLGLLLPLVLAPAAPVAPALPAATVVANARSRATRESKNVLVLFEASWCPWCRQFNTLLGDPVLRPAWERSYVVTKITVRERGARKKYENPGWEAVMKGLRVRDDQDVPYMAVLDAKGNKLEDSLRVGDGPIPSNAGYPSRPEEVAAFVGTIERTGKFQSEEIGILKARLGPTKRPG